MRMIMICLRAVTLNLICSLCIKCGAFFPSKRQSGTEKKCKTNFSDERNDRKEGRRKDSVIREERSISLSLSHVKRKMNKRNDMRKIGCPRLSLTFTNVDFSESFTYNKLVIQLNNVIVIHFVSPIVISSQSQRNEDGRQNLKRIHSDRWNIRDTKDQKDAHVIENGKKRLKVRVIRLVD